MIEYIAITLLFIFWVLSMSYGFTWYIEQLRVKEFEEFKKSLKRGAKSIKQSMDEDLVKYG